MSYVNLLSGSRAERTKPNVIDSEHCLDKTVITQLISVRRTVDISIPSNCLKILQNLNIPDLKNIKNLNISNSNNKNLNIPNLNIANPNISNSNILNSNIPNSNIHITYIFQIP